MCDMEQTVPLSNWLDLMQALTIHQDTLEVSSPTRGQPTASKQQSTLTPLAVDPAAANLLERTCLTRVLV